LIRPGQPGDEAEIASCHTHAWQQSYRGLIADEVLARRPLGFRGRLAFWRKILNESKDHGVFVAESADHGVVGFVVAGAARDAHRVGEGEIEAIYLLQEYKKKGLGRALLKRALSALGEKGFLRNYVWVLENNPAVQFYEKMGAQRLSDEKIIDLGGPLKEVALGWNYV
jgi:GNAT superfamily N-acetyltransferase